MSEVDLDAGDRFVCLIQHSAANLVAGLERDGYLGGLIGRAGLEFELVWSEALGSDNKLMADGIGVDIVEKELALSVGLGAANLIGRAPGVDDFRIGDRLALRVVDDAFHRSAVRTPLQYDVEPQQAVLAGVDAEILPLGQIVQLVEQHSHVLPDGQVIEAKAALGIGFNIVERHAPLRGAVWIDADTRQRFAIGVLYAALHDTAGAELEFQNARMIDGEIDDADLGGVILGG